MPEASATHNPILWPPGCIIHSGVCVCVVYVEGMRKGYGCVYMRVGCRGVCTWRAAVKGLWNSEGLMHVRVKSKATL